MSHKEKSMWLEIRGSKIWHSRGLYPLTIDKIHPSRRQKRIRVLSMEVSSLIKREPLHMPISSFPTTPYVRPSGLPPLGMQPFVKLSLKCGYKNGATEFKWVWSAWKQWDISLPWFPHVYLVTQLKISLTLWKHQYALKYSQQKHLDFFFFFWLLLVTRRAG